MPAKLYRSIGMGGTFDHLHLGHQTFINFASQFADFLTIGITDERMIRDKTYAGAIQSFEVRKNAVIQFCHQHQIRCKVFRLVDQYGPTLDSESVDAVAVTEDTVLGGKKINELRQKLKLRPLIIHVCSLVRDEMGEVISSSRIRAGLINRSGMRYDRIFQKDLIITDQQKTFFSQPQGELVESPDQASNFNAVVGDKSLKFFLDHHWPVNLGVYDLKEKRAANKDLESLIKQPDLTALSSQGIISAQLIATLQLALTNRKKFIFVEGEEDLAAVALVLLLPLESCIYYGQPKLGIIEMIATEHKKNQFFEILSQ